MTDNLDIALLLVRVVVGLTVAAHGAQKLLGWFGGHGIRGTAGFLESLGFNPGRPYAWLLGGVELVGGLALAAGFVTPMAAAAVAGVMLAAIAVVHWQHGFFAMDGGYEFPLTLAVTARATAFSGGGRWSVDRALDWTFGSERWGIAAAVMAVLCAAVAVSARGIRVHRRGRTPVTA